MNLTTKDLLKHSFVITIDDNHSVITGTLSDGVLTLENMLDMGLNMTMEKQES